MHVNPTAASRRRPAGKPAPRTGKAPRKSAGKSAAKPATGAAKKASPKPASRPGAKVRRKPAAKPGHIVQATSAVVEPPKTKKKLVRDSFTMPQADFDLIAALKERALGFRRPTKKSELLRSGLQVLAALDDTALRAALEALPPLKTGRPKQSA